MPRKSFAQIDGKKKRQKAATRKPWQKKTFNQAVHIFFGQLPSGRENEREKVGESEKVRQINAIARS